MKLSFLLLLSVLTISLYAEDGIQFSHGTWKETLAKAKAENKLIFIDVYTSWCGPCKMMAKDVFPQKSVGDKFNAEFINYKIDAEKGEGIAIAKQFSVSAFPTYLFVNGDGVLYYRSVGSMSKERFLQEADNALTEFKDPKPLTVWEAEFPSKKMDKEFLFAYLKKRQKMRLESDEVQDLYVALASREELLTKEVMSVLLKAETAYIDGPLYKFITENMAEIEKTTGIPVANLQSDCSYFISTDLKRAINKKDPALLEKLIDATKAIPSDINMDWRLDVLRMQYYAQTFNEQELIKVLHRYSKSLLAYDKNIIKEKDVASIKKLEETIATGMLKNYTPDEIALSRKLNAGRESMAYAYRIRELSEAALKAVNDKKVLHEALEWIYTAEAFSDNFSIPEIGAGLLQKLGERDRAIQYQLKSIDAFDRMKIENDIIRDRLTTNLEKIKTGQPTWEQPAVPATIAPQK